ncbi:MAG: hypothetical protein GY940_22005, partial [bacterium]|nr:hypothetical protein [bacterium]
KARIVWQHIGWDNTGEMTVSLLKRLLKAHPNLYLSLRVEEPLRVRAGGSLPNRIVDENWKIKNEWMVFIKAFPDRFMLGGDEFVGIPGRSRRMPQSFEETWPILKQLPSQLAKQLGHSNPARVYNLK